MKKNYADARRAAEDRIRQAAVICGDPPPLITFFGPVEKKRRAWKRTRNVLDCQQQAGVDIEVRRFRPLEIGWRQSIRRVISLDLSPAAKILLLYAYDRAFESGEFFASSETAAEDTRLHPVHVKRTLVHLANLKHLQRVKRDRPKGVWRYALLAPIHELPSGNFKLPEQGMKSDAGNVKLPPAVTLGASGGNVSLPKADISNRINSSRSTRDGEGEPDQKPLPEMDRSTRSYCEKELLDHLARIMGPSEMVKNAPMWRLRIRSYHLAITGAIKEYYGLLRNERDEIKNRAAWITDRYSKYGGRSIEAVVPPDSI
jgi:hypothetical protein